MVQIQIVEKADGLQHVLDQTKARPLLRSHIIDFILDCFFDPKVHVRFQDLRGDVMTTSNDFTSKITAHVIDQIEARLREAHLVSANAKGFAAQGLDDRSVETLLGIEPLIFDTKTLLEATTVLRRVRSV